MRRQHNFKVGDKIERDDGLTCIVERIDPACNNVYGKDFSQTRYIGNEISHPEVWHVVKSASDTPPTLAYDTADLHIYSQENRGRYNGKTVLREVITASGAPRAKRIVEEKAANLPTGTTYRAVVQFWDDDVIEYTFTVEAPEPKNAVNFE